MIPFVVQIRTLLRIQRGSNYKYRDCCDRIFQEIIFYKFLAWESWPCVVHVGYGLRRL